MKRLLLLPLLVPLGLIAAMPPARPASATRPARLVPAGAVQGDFDGDGQLEYVWLTAPPLAPDQESCVGKCAATLTSSNPAFKPYRLPQAIGGKLTCFHHLSAGRRDYLGILPDWFTSCWRTYYVLTYRAGGWQAGVPPFAVHCNQWEANVVPIAPDPAVMGHVLVRASVWAPDSIGVRTTSVPLR